MCICLLCLFETPRWLVFHGKEDKARRVMKKIRSDDKVEEELKDIINDYELTSKNSIGTWFNILLYILWTYQVAKLHEWKCIKLFIEVPARFTISYLSLIMFVW